MSMTLGTKSCFGLVTDQIKECYCDAVFMGGKRLLDKQTAFLRQL